MEIESRKNKFHSNTNRKRKSEMPRIELEPDIEKRIRKSKCLDNHDIPKHLRRVFAEIETNPLKVLVTNFPIFGFS